jgi:hypothetical protein
MVSRVKNADCLRFQPGGSGGTQILVPPVQILGNPEFGPTDQTEPTFGFRLCVLKVSPVPAEFLFFVFNISTSKHQNPILLDRNPLPAMCFV